MFCVTWLPNLHFWFRELWFWVSLFPPQESVFPPGGLMDYNLTLQETGWVQGVKAVCVCQAKFVPAAAGLRGISHLSPQWVETDLIADSCPANFLRGQFRPRHVNNVQFPLNLHFFLSDTLTTSYRTLARQPARRKRGHKCRSGVSFPISPKIINYS